MRKKKEEVLKMLRPYRVIAKGTMYFIYMEPGDVVYCLPENSSKVWMKPIEEEGIGPKDRVYRPTDEQLPILPTEEVALEQARGNMGAVDQVNVKKGMSGKEVFGE